LKENDIARKIALWLAASQNLAVATLRKATDKVSALGG
jgi:hypothetical protein